MISPSGTLQQEFEIIFVIHEEEQNLNNCLRNIFLNKQVCFAVTPGFTFLRMVETSYSFCLTSCISRSPIHLSCNDLDTRERGSSYFHEYADQSRRIFALFNSFSINVWF